MAKTWLEICDGLIAHFEAQLDRVRKLTGSQVEIYHKSIVWDDACDKMYHMNCDNCKIATACEMIPIGHCRPRRHNAIKELERYIKALQAIRRPLLAARARRMAMAKQKDFEKVADDGARNTSI